MYGLGMLKRCCQNTLYVGFDLKLCSVNCGDCAVAWTREESSFTWVGSDGTEVEFSPDEMVKKLDPEQCCKNTLDKAVKEYYCITHCPCGIKWSRHAPSAATWNAYKQQEVA